MRLSPKDLILPAIVCGIGQIKRGFDDELGNTLAAEFRLIKLPALTCPSFSRGVVMVKVAQVFLQFCIVGKEHRLRVAEKALITRGGMQECKYTVAHELGYPSG